MADNSAGGAVYVPGLSGMAVDFLGQAATFWAGVPGFLKAIVWPAFRVFQAPDYLKLQAR